MPLFSQSSQNGQAGAALQLPGLPVFVFAVFLPYLGFVYRRPSPMVRDIR